MVARVTCSFWSLGPWSKAFPPLWLLHGSTCLPCSVANLQFGPSHYIQSFVSDKFASSMLQLLISHAPLSRSVLEVIMSNDALSETLVDRIHLFFVCLCVCCLSPQTKAWLGLCHQIHLQVFHQPGKPDFQVSHPHALDCRPLTCANMKERDGEREGEKQWNGKNIPAFGYWVGCRKENCTAEQTSVAIGLHLYTPLFSSLFSLLIHSLFL